MKVEYNNYKLKKIANELKIGIVNNGGRNFTGKICVRGKGGGLKERTLKVDNFRRIEAWGKIVKILKERKKTGYMGLVIYNNGLSSVIRLAEGTRLLVYSGEKKEKEEQFYKGTSTIFSNINNFTKVSNIELYPWSGFVMNRAAGVGALYVGRKDGKALIKLPSGWQVFVKQEAMATIGGMSNEEHKIRSLGKAGVKRKLGFRPKVRGVAKNPCDHPHGGGNGKKSPPVMPLTPWGKKTKWTPTTKKKNDRRKRRLWKENKKEKNKNKNETNRV